LPQIPLGGLAAALKDKTLPLLRCERTNNLFGVRNACERQGERYAFQKPATRNEKLVHYLGSLNRRLESA
jgi:hypothetical protein